MKLLMGLFFLLQGVFAFGQGGRVYVDSTTSYTFRRHHEHCGATRAGEGLLIGGGALVALGGFIALSDIQSGRGNAQANSKGGMVAGAVAGVGAGVAFYGAILYLAGRDRDNRHRQRLTVFGKRDEVGLAFNF